MLLADDMDPVMLAALAAQPKELSPIAAFRRAFDDALATMSEDEWEFERTRQRLIFSIPELKAAQYDEYFRAITMFAEALSERLGRDRDDFEVRAFAGAVSGALLGVIDRAPASLDTIYRTLDFLEAGMPLPERLRLGDGR